MPFTIDPFSGRLVEASPTPPLIGMTNPFMGPTNSFGFQNPTGPSSPQQAPSGSPSPEAKGKVPAFTGGDMGKMSEMIEAAFDPDPTKYRKLSMGKERPGIGDYLIGGPDMQAFKTADAERQAIRMEVLGNLVKVALNPMTFGDIESTPGLSKVAPQPIPGVQIPSPGPGQAPWTPEEQSFITNSGEAIRDTPLTVGQRSAISPILSGQVPGGYEAANFVKVAEGQHHLAQAKRTQAPTESDLKVSAFGSAVEAFVETNKRIPTKTELADLKDKAFGITEKEKRPGTTGYQRDKVALDTDRQKLKQETAKGTTAMDAAFLDLEKTQSEIDKLHQEVKSERTLLPARKAEIEARTSELKAQFALDVKKFNDYTPQQRLAIMEERLKLTERQVGVAESREKLQESLAGLRASLTAINLLDLPPKEKAKLLERGVNILLGQAGLQVQPGANLEVLGLSIPKAPDLGMPREKVVEKPAGGPKAGTVENGYKFKGGDPSKRENWIKQ